MCANWPVCTHTCMGMSHEVQGVHVALLFPQRQCSCFAEVCSFWCGLAQLTLRNSWLLRAEPLRFREESPGTWRHLTPQRRRCQAHTICSESCSGSSTAAISSRNTSPFQSFRSQEMARGGWVSPCLACVHSLLHGGLGWRSPLWLTSRLGCAAGCWFGAGHHPGAEVWCAQGWG
jgi:hypothetical protein